MLIDSIRVLAITSVMIASSLCTVSAFDADLTTKPIFSDDPILCPYNYGSVFFERYDIFGVGAAYTEREAIDMAYHSLSLQMDFESAFALVPDYAEVTGHELNVLYEELTIEHNKSTGIYSCRIDADIQGEIYYRYLACDGPEPTPEPQEIPVPELLEEIH